MKFMQKAKQFVDRILNSLGYYRVEVLTAQLSPEQREHLENLRVMLWRVEMARTAFKEGLVTQERILDEYTKAGFAVMDSVKAKVPVELIEHRIPRELRKGLRGLLASVPA